MGHGRMEKGSLAAQIFRAKPPFNSAPGTGRIL